MDKYSSIICSFASNKERSCTMEDCIIDVAQVASSMKINSSWSHASRMSPKRCIFTVPRILSRHNKRAYIPTTFSIGPLHHNESLQKHTHNIKIHYLNGLVTRVGINVEDLIAAVAKIETKARDHYGEALNLSPSKLVEILVLDGCFIIELFRKWADPLFGGESDDPVFSMSCMSKYLLHDLMLLENQIPWMVLELLFNLTRGVNSEYPLAVLILKTYQDTLPIMLPIFLMETEDMFQVVESIRGNHILGLLRNALIDYTPPSDMSLEFLETETCSNNRYDGLPPIPSVMELKNRGIHLKKCEPNRQLIINFEKGVLQVSPIRIDDTTEALFRNIIAFEQCSPWCPPIFTSFAILLDNLINTTEDLEELRREGIITFLLNPEDALNFFNRLYIDTSYNTFYYPYHKVCRNINAYCQQKWPRYRAMLVQNYFSNPWVTASTFAAIALLVLTLLQTVYAMKGSK